MALIYRELSKLPAVLKYEPDYKEEELPAPGPRDISITVENGVYIVTGAWIDKIVSSVNFDDYESWRWFDKALRESGLYQQLEERGIEDGDTVSLDGYEFEYQY